MTTCSKSKAFCQPLPFGGIRFEIYDQMTISVTGGSIKSVHEITRSVWIHLSSKRLDLLFVYWRFEQDQIMSVSSLCGVFTKIEVLRQYYD